MFSKRHYEWLAQFAGKFLSEEQCDRLCYELAGEARVKGVHFKPSTFLDVCHRHRTYMWDRKPQERPLGSVTREGY